MKYEITENSNFYINYKIDDITIKDNILNKYNKII
jgi:hypothetical protein